MIGDGILIPLPVPPHAKPEADPNAQKAVDSANQKLNDDVRKGASQDTIKEDLAATVLAQSKATPDSSGGDELDRIKNMQKFDKSQQKTVMQAWDDVFGGEKNLGSIGDLAVKALGPLLDQSGKVDPKTLLNGDAYDKLGKDNQDKLQRLLTADTNEWGSQVRDSFKKLIQSDSFTHADADGQSKQIDDFLTKQPWLNEDNNQDKTPNGRDSSRVPIDVTKAKDQPDANQKEDLYNAVIHTKDGDVHLNIHMSTQDPKNTLSLDEVKKALAQLPHENIANLKDVYVKPDKSFNAYASGQEFTFQGAADNQNSVDRVALHETGHTVEFNLESAGDNLPGGAIRDQWKKAMASDGFNPSNYAKTNDVEDFAEAERLYQEVKGTPNEAQARAMFPARFALLDRIYDGDLKKYGLGSDTSSGGGDSGGGDSGSVPPGKGGSGSGSASAFGAGTSGSDPQPTLSSASGSKGTSGNDGGWGSLIAAVSRALGDM